MKTGEAFNTGCGGGCGLVLGIIAAVILIPVVTIIGCVALTGGIFVVAPAVDAARDAAKRAEEKNAEASTKKPDEPKSYPVVPSPPGNTNPLPVISDAMPEPDASWTPPPIVNANLRTWTNASGEYKIEAEFVSMAAGKVKLKKADGMIVTLPMDKLSDEDQKWIRKRGK